MALIYIKALVICLFICLFLVVSLPVLPESTRTNAASMGRGFTLVRQLQVIQTAPAEANQANQEAPRNVGCVQIVVSILRHFLLLFLPFSLSVHGTVGWCCYCR